MMIQSGIAQIGTRAEQSIVQTFSVKLPENQRRDTIVDRMSEHQYL